MSDWSRICGHAVAFLGTQEQFKRESNVLKRLVVKFGPLEVERMIAGATLLGWRSLLSLGSADGLGRRMALAKYWQSKNAHPAKIPERLKSILWKMVNQ